MYFYERNEKLTFSNIRIVIQESFYLYWLTLTDRNKAIEMIKDDEEYIRIRDEIRENSTSDENEKDIDIDALVKKSKELLKNIDVEAMEKNVPIYLDKFENNREVFKSFLASRLEIMIEVSNEFLQSYQGSKAKSREKITSDPSFLKEAYGGIFNIMDTDNADHKNDTSKSTQH